MRQRMRWRVCVSLIFLGMAQRVDALSKIDLPVACRALFDAAFKGDARMIKQALARGADPNCRTSPAGTTALMAAVTNAPLSAVLPLLKAGADLNARDSEGNTALIFAALSGRVETVKALLKRGADAGIKNNNGLTALSAVEETVAAPKAEVIRLLGGTPKSGHSREQR